MVLALGPAGCGFQPIYARNGGQQSSQVAGELASIQVSSIENRLGQQLRNSLVQRLTPRGEAGSGQYTLTITLTESLQGLANSRDGNATVGRVNIIAKYSLQDTVSGALLYSGEVTGFSGYRYLGPRYASTVSERDSETSAVIEIAAEIHGALASYFSDRGTFEQRQKQRPPVPVQVRGDR